ncbi:MAG: polysaccharide biosynthesis C-terminal domain-containing protein, partial [Pseudomonadota bacterium]
IYNIGGRNERANLHLVQFLGGTLTQVLTLMVVPFVFNFFAGPALTAANRAGAVLQVALVQLAATLLFSWIAVGFGVVAVAGAYVARAYLTMPLQQYMLDRHLGIAMASTWRAMMVPLGSAVVMAAVVHLSLPALTGLYGPGWTAALFAVGLGAGLYLSLIAILAWSQLRDIVTTLLSLRTEKKAA